MRAAHRLSCWMLGPLVVVAHIVASGCASSAPRAARPPAALTGAFVGVHDPCVIRSDGYYYVFSTGPGIPVRRSRDLCEWQLVGRVFDADVPAPAAAVIAGAKDVWAPDIAFIDGRYVLTYAVSTFGSSRSVIAMASTSKLGPGCEWRDDGVVIETQLNSDHNAIDGNLVQDGAGGILLVFGSFWTGIKLVELDRATLKPRPGAELIALARREPPGAIEAPFIVRRGGWWHLFVSFDQCCKGVNSTYNLRVGRSRELAGPYVDRDGRALLDGGGTLILAGAGTLIGPGHCAVLEDGGRWLLFCHAYDADRGGEPVLVIRELEWSDDGWPTVRGGGEPG